MKLRISFFNPTVLRKDITRFAPVWGLYALFQLLFVMLIWESGYSAAAFANTAPEILMAMGLVNFLYAPLVAVLLFGDLFTARMCNALHALPIRREGWFATHLTAGMLFCLVPNALGALLSAALLQQYCYAAFLWLAVMLLQYLFFFGVAAFSCLCAGNRLGSVAVYGIFNFLAVLAGFLYKTFYEPVLRGIELNFQTIANHSPIVRFSQSNYLLMEYDNMENAVQFQGFIWEEWRYLLIAAGIGLALLALSLVIYRLRQLESAGDLISFRPAAPVFLIIYTLCAGALLYLIADLSAPAMKYVFLVAGFGIGFFTGKMLLERKTRVFRGKNFLVFGIFLAIFATTIGITALDPMGITRYVPQQENVSQVFIAMSNSSYERENSALPLSDPADIAEITKLHQDCIDSLPSSKQDGVPLYLRYEMANGATVERAYYVNEGTKALSTLRILFSRPQAVFQGIEPQELLKSLRLLEVFSNVKNIPILAVATHTDYMDADHYEDKFGSDCKAYIADSTVDDPLLKGLLEALAADCAAGNMAQPWALRTSGDYANIVLELRADGRHTKSLNLFVSENCEHTVAFLESVQLQ